MSSTERPVAAPAPHARPATAAAEHRMHRAWRFYSVMAFLTGIMLLLLVAEMVLVYVVGVGPDVEAAIRWIPFAHGWIYVVYLVSVFHLWSVMRWSVGRMVALVVAGVVPVLSFVMERRARSWFEADVAARAGRGA